MYIKLNESEDSYHCCKEHLEKMDKLNALEDSENWTDKTYSEPEEVCEECQDLAKEGKCHPVFVKTGSFTD